MPVSTKGWTTKQKTQHYVNVYAPTAVAEMKKYQIPASITLAQGILESGMGQSTLARKANNHFGIKCHKGWRGKKIYHDDDKKGECFRVYKNPLDSYRDHSLFLKDRRRYAFLFELKRTNYTGWAKGLKKAGYATDPKYAKKLIRLIEEYRLYRFDSKRKFKKEASTPVVLKKGSIHKVKKGDTLYSISKKYNVSIEVLQTENNLKNKTIYIGQKLTIPNSN